MFTISLNKIESLDALIPVMKFDNKKEARKKLRELMKEHNCIKHAGHIVNYSDRKEIYTNF